jgi:hypothetical protein
MAWENSDSQPPVNFLCCFYLLFGEKQVNETFQFFDRWIDRKHAECKRGFIEHEYLI